MNNFNKIQSPQFRKKIFPKNTKIFNKCILFCHYAIVFIKSLFIIVLGFAKVFHINSPKLA